MTYEGKIKSILKEHCTECHSQDGGTDPMMDTWKDAKAHATRIIARIQAKTMPSNALDSSTQATVVKAFAAWKTAKFVEKDKAGASASSGSSDSSSDSSSADGSSNSDSSSKKTTSKCK